MDYFSIAFRHYIIIACKCPVKIETKLTLKLGSCYRFVTLMLY